MIAAIDPGIGHCGWALVEPGTGRVDRCGVILTQFTDATAAVDRARRLRGIIHELLLTWGRWAVVSSIAAEAPLSFGPIQAVAPQIALWGALIGLEARWGRRIPLYEVSAKTWQHAVMPESPSPVTPSATRKSGRPRRPRRGKINYKLLEAKLAAYMGRAALAHIAPADRTHALDAVGVGVLVALRPELATRI